MADTRSVWRKAVQRMSDKSGRDRCMASVGTGHHSRFIDGSAYHGNPTLATMLEVCRGFGYDIALVSNSDGFDVSEMVRKGERHE